MEWKKLGFSEHFLWPGRKVVSGFSLGVGASLIVLTLLFLNSSLKVPVVTPLFQGYNITRPLSLSTSSSSGVANATDGGGIGTATPDLPSAVGLGKRVEEGSGVSKIRGGNVSDTAREESILGGQGETHLGNFIDEAGNGSLSGVGEGRVEDGGHARNGSVVADKSSEKPILGVGISASNVTAQNITEGNCVEGSSCDGNYSASVGGSAGDVSSLGKVGRFHGGEEGNLGTNLAGTSDEKSNITGYDSHPVEMKRNFDESCDIFDGRWVRDDTKPYYPAGSCPYIDKDFDCHLNGRPDDGFLKWKWQPNGCDMPSLNATDFLERLRGKKLVFVGDSLNRNMWESLVCILRHSVQNKTKVYEISGRSEFKKKGFYAFRFEDYSCSVDFVGAPFLVRESVYNSRNGSLETLRLDLMDRTTSMYHDADVIVFNTGHWWTHEKTSRGEDYYQEGDYVYPRLKVLEAYKRALTTWARWVDENIDHNRTQVLFRGYSVTHFRRGRWNSGGQCHKEVDPIFNDSYLAKYPSKMRALEYVLKGMKTPVTFLNISKLTDYRKDGHPSIYRTAYKTVEEQIGAEKSQDCSHWCLPGVPDTWNELLYATLLQTGRGSWRN